MSYAIIADSSRLTAGVTASRNELKALKDTFISTRTPVEQYSAKMAELERLQAKFPASADAIQRKMAALRDEFDAAHPSAASLGSVLEGPAAAGMAAFAAAAGVAMLALRAFQPLAAAVHARMLELDATAKKSRLLGMSPGDLVGLTGAASDIAGVEGPQLETGLTKFAKNISEAASTGKGGAADALKLLGLSAQNLSGMGLTDAFMAVADAISKVENPAERIQLAFDLLGKSGAEMATLLAAGGDEIRKVSEDFRALSQIDTIDTEGIEQANDALGHLEVALQGVGNVTADAFAPLVKSIGDDLVNALVDATGQGTGFHDMMADLAIVTAGLADELMSAGNALASVDTDFADFIKKIAPSVSIGLSAGAIGMSMAHGADENSHVGRLLKARREGAERMNAPEAGSNLGDIAERVSEEDQARLQSWWDKYFEGLDKITADKLAAETKRIQEIADAGEKLADSLKTPSEKLQDQFTTLQDAFSNWSISPETFQKGLEDLQSKANDMAGGAASAQPIGAVHAGSIEALREQFRGQTDTAKAEQAAIKNQENTAAAAKLLEDIKTTMSANAIKEAV